MFKKKPIYIILLVVFTLLLCFDIAAYAITSANSSKLPGDLPEGMHNNGPQMGENIERPDTGDEAFDSSNMPEFQDGEMPDTSDGDIDSSQIPGGQDGEMPNVNSQDFDASHMHNSGRAADAGVTESSFLNSIIGFFASWWILIGIVCLVVDALCVFMLIRLKGDKIV